MTSTILKIDDEYSDRDVLFNFQKNLLFIVILLY